MKNWAGVAIPEEGSNMIIIGFWPSNELTFQIWIEFRLTFFTS